jgi:alpha-glucosidase
MKTNLLLIVAACLLSCGCFENPTSQDPARPAEVLSDLQLAARTTARPLRVESPDGRLMATVSLDESGAASLSIGYRGAEVVAARLGLHFAGAQPLDRGFSVVGAARNTRDETYAVPVGKTSRARDHHRELVVSLEEAAAPKRRLDVAIRAFDDGIAFRYVVPEQAGLAEVVLVDELTELAFAGDPTAHALPLGGYTTSYEKYYQTARVSRLDRAGLFGLPMLLEQTASEPTGGATWIAVTEAALENYAGMYLAAVDGRPGALAAKLSPLPGRADGAKVVGRTPLASPWRVAMIADDPGRLLESNIVFNLNEPSKIADASWIKPGRTTFPWWNGYVLEGVDFEPGLNTATYKHYIDFCAEHGIEYHSLDGADTAWYGGPITPNGPTDVTKAVPEIDLPELLRYARERGVRLRLWMHWRALRPQLDEAFAKYEAWGVEGVMIDFMDRDDQEMVAFYHEVAEKAARHRLTVTWHGAYKPTGMERTWPNVFNYEAALNQEYNKWDPVGTPPEHNLAIAMIRGIAGPVDYHHGGMRNVLPDAYQPRDKAPLVQGTRGHQLALYVVYHNALPMMVDYPAAYRGQPGLEFLAAVPTNWDETRVLHAELGRALVVARRRGEAWYVGGIAAAQSVDLGLPLEFLGSGDYRAKLTADDPAHGSTAVVERALEVAADDRLDVSMPVGGGFVAVLEPAAK